MIEKKPDSYAGIIGLVVLFRGTRENLFRSIEFKILNSKDFEVGKTHEYLICATNDEMLWFYSFSRGTYLREKHITYFEQLNFKPQICKVYKPDPKKPTYLKLVE